MLIRNIEDISPPIKTYKCFSPNLASFLADNDILPVYKYIHNSNTGNKKYVWIYVLCNELSELLTNWSNNKPLLEGGEKFE